MIGIIESIATSGSNYTATVGLNDSGTGLGPILLTVPFSSVSVYPTDLITQIQSKTNDVCDLNSISRPSTWQYMADIGSIVGISNAPQAAPANASGGTVTNLPTNFNLVSGVLGVANGLNDANTAQNDLATKFNDFVTKHNSLVGKLVTEGILS